LKLFLEDWVGRVVLSWEPYFFSFSFVPFRETARHPIFVDGSRQLTFQSRWNNRRYGRPSLDQSLFRGKYHCTVDLLFDRFGMSCMTTDNFCFYLQKRLNPNQSNRRSTVQWYFPFSIPWFVASVACIINTLQS